MSTNLQPDDAAAPAAPGPVSLKQALKDNIKRSERDSRIDPKLMITAILLLLMGGGALYTFFYSGTVMKVVKGADENPIAIELTATGAARMMPTPTATRIVLSIDGTSSTGGGVVSVVDIATPAPVFPPLATPDVAATVLAILAARDAAVVPAPALVEPSVIREYIEVPGQTITVTHTITQEVYVGPTPTPVMSPGVVRICLYGEGFTGLYVNDAGVPGNECRDYPVAGLVNHYQITVTK